MTYEDDKKIAKAAAEFELIKAIDDYVFYYGRVAALQKLAETMSKISEHILEEDHANK